MFLGQTQSRGGFTRMVAKKTVKPVNFYCAAPAAKQVYLTGDFNDWSLTATPMKRQLDGNWYVQVDLPHGTHRYLLVIDEELALDPRASGNSQNEDGSVCSFISVS
jgi:1,4-alpha-glucan branching enzyme